MAGLRGYDERFSSPGGGFVNHDLFERACRLPDSQLIMLLGEATFHQMHGGAATGNPSSSREEFAAEYRRLRGRKFSKPRVPALYLGALPRQALPTVAAAAARAASALAARRS